MRKTLAFILIIALCLSFAACGNDDGSEDYNNGIDDLLMKITVDNIEFSAVLYDNETAAGLIEMLPMTVNMSEHGGFEKYFDLSDSLHTSAFNPETIQAGDIMLYGNNCLVLFYKTHSTSYGYTKIGKIVDTTGLAAVLGNGSVTVKFEIIEVDTSDESEIPTEPTEPGIPIENEVTEMFITINGNIFKAELYDNQTSKAFAAMLPMTIIMSELNNNEKYYYLPENLPTAALSAGAIQAGDIMLWGSNCLVFFYESFLTSYSYTKIGRIENASGITAALGAGNVTVTFSKK